MENIILIIHVVIAVLLIGSVLMQSSEGGALGIGTGDSALMSSSSASNFLTKFTSVLAIFFIITSISLTIIPQQYKPTGSIIDEIDQIEEKNKTQQIPPAK